VYGVAGLRPDTVRVVELAPTEGPATQGPVPTRYCETKLDSLFDASVHPRTAVVAVIDLTAGLVGCAGSATVLPSKNIDHFVPRAFLAPTWNV